MKKSNSLLPPGPILRMQRIIWPIKLDHIHLLFGEGRRIRLSRAERRKRSPRVPLMAAAPDLAQAVHGRSLPADRRTGLAAVRVDPAQGGWVGPLLLVMVTIMLGR
jgi:hypothetical protein